MTHEFLVVVVVWIINSGVCLREQGILVVGAFKRYQTTEIKATLSSINRNLVAIPGG
jgi:hypothetical protein